MLVRIIQKLVSRSAFFFFIVFSAIVNILIAAPQQSDAIFEKIFVQGYIQGKSLQSVSGQDSIFSIRNHIAKTDHRYFYRLYVDLVNISNHSINIGKEDSLVIYIRGLSENNNHDKQYSDLHMLIDAQFVAATKDRVHTYYKYPVYLSSFNCLDNKAHWIGLHSKYYALLLFPCEHECYENNSTFSHYLPDSDLSIGVNYCDSTGSNNVFLSFGLPHIKFKPGQTLSGSYLLFFGPKSTEALTSGPVNIKSLLFADLSFWMRWLSFRLLHLLRFIYSVLPNWGGAIVVLAFVIRLILFPFANKANKSQQRFVNAQKKMQPELTEIKKTYKGGEQSEKILELYKKHKVSPFSGLKPLLIVLVQLPILISLYHVLGSVFELRDAGFLWIESLAEPDRLFYFGFHIPVLGDHFNMLPFLMAAITMISFRLSPGPVTDNKDKNMQKIFMPLMAIGFFLLFYSFPSGMVLYWTFANVFHLMQQKLILKRPII